MQGKSGKLADVFKQTRVNDPEFNHTVLWLQTDWDIQNRFNLRRGICFVPRPSGEIIPCSYFQEGEFFSVRPNKGISHPSLGSDARTDWGRTQYPFEINLYSSIPGMGPFHLMEAQKAGIGEMTLA